MSSEYPMLENRTIDQLKVLELKEELRRLQLPVGGLKDDLVKRLGEALCTISGNVDKEEDNVTSLEPVTDQRKNQERVDGESKPINESTEAVLDSDFDKIVKGGDVMVDEVVNGIGSAPTQEGDETVGIISSTLEDNLDPMIGVETTKPIVSEVELNDKDEPNLGTHMDNGNMNTQLENEAREAQQNDEGTMPQQNDEGLKNPNEDLLHHSSVQTNQVSEVSPILGSQVLSDSISTDSLSLLNEKIELKDNIIDDNVKLDIDVVNPEMVEPLSNNLLAVGGESHPMSNNLLAVRGESHPMDVEELRTEQASVEKRDDISVVDADISRKSVSAESHMVYSEKLDLDRSSSDNSMQGDVLETKEIDLKCIDDVRQKNEVNEVPGLKEERIVDIVRDDLSADKKYIITESSVHSAMPAEKRKLSDQKSGGNTQSLKRQRKWKSESLEVPETQPSSLTPSSTLKETIQSLGLKRNFSRSNSSITDSAPKERVVPPTQRLPTDSLRIDHFVRPFTLKAVQDLLCKTGHITDFWMDQIKTHCYVTFSSVKEATDTRNAVYNLQWPTNGGRLLVADFVHPQEVKIRAAPPPQVPLKADFVHPEEVKIRAVPLPQGPPKAAALFAPVSTAPPTATVPKLLPPSSRQQVTATIPQLSPPFGQQVFRNQPPPPPRVLPPPLAPLAYPPASHQVAPPVTLNDIFQKTKANPRIYFLPLSEEQVAAKLASRNGALKEDGDYFSGW